MKDAERFVEKLCQDQQLKVKTMKLFSENKLEELEKVAKDLGCHCNWRQIVTAYRQGKDRKLVVEELVAVTGCESCTSYNDDFEADEDN